MEFDAAANRLSEEELADRFNAHLWTLHREIGTDGGMQALPAELQRFLAGVAVNEEPGYRLSIDDLTCSGACLWLAILDYFSDIIPDPRPRPEPVLRLVYSADNAT